MSAWDRFDRPGFLSPVGYGVNGLDRLAQRREDAVFLAAAARDEAARVLLFSGEAPLIHTWSGKASVAFSLGEARSVCSFGDLFLLGLKDGSPLFAASIDEGSLREAPGVSLSELRSLALDDLLAPQDVGRLAQAKSLLSWHARHGFCSACGQKTKAAAGGWRRECSACGAHHFPRTDPVVIMLAVDGDACLLGRQARFAPGMYSALAGFVEPGETVEDAVRREVREESGVLIGAVAYVGSQPWPFPSSLMLGCFCQATSREVTVDRDELEDARWFSRSEAQSMINGVHPDGLRPPGRIAIAYRLLETWLAG